MRECEKEETAAFVLVVLAICSVCVCVARNFELLATTRSDNLEERSDG